MEITNLFVQSLPGEIIKENYQRQVVNACYSTVEPTPVKDAKLIALSPDVIQLLDLDRDWINSTAFLDIISGNKNIAGSIPYAMCYGGHQFGHWAGQLGDGRAINIADIKVGDQAYTLQLKGAGKTPYSRTADGLAVLRSSIREYLCSEAMFHLGVPTTRALSLVKTGEKVYRDMFYDGNPSYETGAIVCRVAPSFLRFGNYQIFSSRNDLANLKSLVDFTIKNFFPELGEPSKVVYLSWLKSIAEKTMDMVIHWQRVGFVHGVMNTDNMSILGLTIDYGPYGWLENYDPKWTPNTTDGHGRRYAFGNQPNVAVWNVIQLFNAIYPLIDDKQEMQKIVDGLTTYFTDHYQKMLVQKIGFTDCNQEGLNLVNKIFELIQNDQVDYILFFRNLGDVKLDQDIANIPLSIRDSFYESDDIDENQYLDWLKTYRAYCKDHNVKEEDRITTIKKTNPKYVLRNYMAYEIINKVEEGDMTLFNEIEDMLKRPYEDNPKYDRWFTRRPEWATHKAGCSMLSCSS
jgi:uncharacterized protein YdiU (UPF0061 family)